MAVLNLRNVPDATMRALRVAAAQQGVGLHNYCVQLLRGSSVNPPAVAPLGAPVPAPATLVPHDAEIIIT